MNNRHPHPSPTQPVVYPAIALSIHLSLKCIMRTNVFLAMQIIMNIESDTAICRCTLPLHNFILHRNSSKVNNKYLLLQALDMNWKLFQLNADEIEPNFNDFGYRFGNASFDRPICSSSIAFNVYAQLSELIPLSQINIKITNQSINQCSFSELFFSFDFFFDNQQILSFHFLSHQKCNKLKACVEKF